MPTMSKEYLKNYIKAKHMEDYECELCGGHFKKYFKKVHCSSKKHQIAQAKVEEEKLKKNDDESSKLVSENRTLQQELIEAISLLKVFKAMIK